MKVKLTNKKTGKSVVVKKRTPYKKRKGTRLA